MNSKKNIHLVNWSQMCQPLSSDGLGIKHIMSINEALLMKLASGLSLERESLEVQCSVKNRAWRKH